MQFHDRIEAIKTRASRINRSLAEICADADVSYSTIWRWQQAGANPCLQNVERILGALEDHLTKKETALRRALARRRGSPRPAA